MVAPNHLTQVSSGSPSVGKPELGVSWREKQWLPGTVHEFYASANRHAQLPYGRQIPSLLPIIDALTHLPREPGRLTLWIGRSCWPTPFALLRVNENLHHHLFIDAPTDYDHRHNTRSSASRHTALLSLIESAISSYGTHAVVAVVDNLTLTQSRRFALAARKYNSALLLAYRQLPRRSTAAAATATPPEIENLQRLPPSAAHSRWIITPARTSLSTPCYQQTLYSTRGPQPNQRSWIINADTFQEESPSPSVTAGASQHGTSFTSASTSSTSTSLPRALSA